MSKTVIDELNKHMVHVKASKIGLLQKPTLNFQITLTNKAASTLDEKKATLDSYSGRPMVIIQKDRDPVEIPVNLETSEDLEHFIEALLDDDDLTVKFENEGYGDGAIGGIFKWSSSKESLLLVAVYVVDANRLKARKLQTTPFPVKLHTGGKNHNRENLGKLLYSVISLMREERKERLDTGYKKFLDRSFRPFSEYLYHEKLSIRDPRYRPQCRFVKRLEKGDERGFLEVNDPPRPLTEGGNQIAAQDDSGNTYLSVRVADYDDSDQIIVIEDGSRLRDWPDEGIIFLEGDMASNRRKTQAVNLLRTRNERVYAKLADALIRPWGLPVANLEPRSYYHPNISHDNPISVAQANAVDLALSNSDVSLIHGPPGTGKTTVIVEIIRHVTRDGGRVLMVAPTHVAVDNVLERVADEHGINAVRVGGRQYMSEHLKKYRLRDKVTAMKEAMPAFQMSSSNSDFIKIQKEFVSRMERKDRRFFEKLVLEQANLVCGTTIGIARYYENKAKEQVNFDMLIIDEASKATVMEFLVPAVRARRWVLVGDHRQLPPYVNDQELRIYVQRYFDDTVSEKKQKSREYHKKTDDLIGSLRRYHEELHALGEGDPDLHWNRVVNLMNYSRRPLKSMEEMINLALGSCFHYFLRRLDDSRNVHLNVQHRMPFILANFLDQVIYGGHLKTSDNAAQHGLTLPPVESLGLAEISEPMTFLSTEKLNNPHEKQGRRNKGWYNNAEADVIADIIANLASFDAVSHGYTEENPMTIGVITYYADQSRVIVNKLRGVEEIKYTRGWRFDVEGKPIKIRVSIVDRFQGQEQDIVLLSLTRSNKKRRIGFLNNLQRINVSLSRAKQNLLIIGNHRFFKNVGKRTNPPLILRELAYYSEKNSLVRKLTRPKKRHKKGDKRYKKGGDK